MALDLNKAASDFLSTPPGETIREKRRAEEAGRFLGRSEGNKYAQRQ
jgi:hypothetical protein